MAEFDISSRLPQFKMPAPVAKPELAAPTSNVGASTGGASFIDNLKAALNNVNDAIQSSDKAAQKFSAGKAENLHDVMIAMEKADVSLRTLTAVRGKILDAYHEIMKMPI